MPLPLHFALVKKYILILSDSKINKMTFLVSFLCYHIWAKVVTNHNNIFNKIRSFCPKFFTDLVPSSNYFIRSDT